MHFSGRGILINVRGRPSVVRAAEALYNMFMYIGQYNNYQLTES